MSRKKESLPPVSSQETEEKEIRKKSRVKEPPHQTSEPETNKVDLKDLNAAAKSAQKKSIVSRKKKQNDTQDSSLECLKDTKPVSPETTKPKRKRRTKAEMEAARKELEKEMVEKETEEPEKKRRGRKKETNKESKPTETQNKVESKDASKKSVRKEAHEKAQEKAQVQEETQTASKPAKKPKKGRKKELIYAVCLKNGGEMVVEEAGEKTRKKYEGAMYELMISDTLAVLKKSEVPSARIKPMEEDMYYEINDELYHVEFYRNGRRIG